MEELTAALAPRHGLSRRKFLASSAGMAAAFLAMNDVFGPVFEVSRAEAASPTIDKIAAMKAEYLAAGGQRTNARYGYVARSRA